MQEWVGPSSGAAVLGQCWSWLGAQEDVLPATFYKKATTSVSWKDETTFLSTQVSPTLALSVISECPALWHWKVTSANKTSLLPMYSILYP